MDGSLVGEGCGGAERASVVECNAVVAAFRRYGWVDRLRTVAGKRKERDGAGRRESETAWRVERNIQLEQTIVSIVKGQGRV